MWHICCPGVLEIYLIGYLSTIYKQREYLSSRQILIYLIMLPTINPTTTRAWQALQAHYQEVEAAHMRDLFAQDEHRAERFSLWFEDILVDFSKNRLTDKTLELLYALAEECQVAAASKAMFAGARINARCDAKSTRCT